jgi:hypothetical protein
MLETNFTHLNSPILRLQHERALIVRFRGDAPLHCTVRAFTNPSRSLDCSSSRRNEELRIDDMIGESWRNGRGSVYDRRITGHTFFTYVVLILRYISLRQWRHRMHIWRITEGVLLAINVCELLITPALCGSCSDT